MRKGDAYSSQKKASQIEDERNDRLIGRFDTEFLRFIINN